MEKETDYAKQQAEKHKRKIVLPSCISWEYGSNKFASQKGQSAFGTIRNTKLNNDSDVQYWQKNDVVHYVYEQVPNADEDTDVKTGKLETDEKTSAPSPSVPKFQAQGLGNNDNEHYKAWIGGQATTFTPTNGQ